ncbi:MAG: hypothetical protein H7Z10_06750 [Gemmatimonadaceae bacterium]|nr:hypothetical protein [Acetobacteraceae bacterium]
MLLLTMAWKLKVDCPLSGKKLNPCPFNSAEKKVTGPPLEPGTNVTVTVPSKLCGVKLKVSTNSPVTGGMKVVLKVPPGPGVSVNGIAGASCATVTVEQIARAVAAAH